MPETLAEDHWTVALRGIRCVRLALQRVWDLQDERTLAGVEVLPHTHTLHHCRNLTPLPPAAQ